MDKAIEICKGKERLISAAEVKQRYRGGHRINARYVCPLCGQPLYTASMSSNKTAPHFRHERSNPRAQQCENYVSAHGYPSTYQRAPLPMYIRQAHGKEGAYIVEAGFRQIKPSLLKTLQEDGATLWIDDRCFKITETRFGSGITRLPFKAPTLACSSQISVEHAQFGLPEIWGVPLDATRALVFSHDEETHQGRRLHPGDTVQPGDRLYVLVPDFGTHDIYAAVPHAEIVGHTGTTLSSSYLYVCDVKIPLDAEARSESSNFLDSCGIEIADDDRAPTLVWPPAITHDGNAMPLFSKSECIFCTSRSASIDHKLYIHTSLDSHDYVRTEILKPTASPNYLYCAVSCSSDLSIISTGNWSHNSILLLHPTHSTPSFTQDPFEDKVLVTMAKDGTVFVESNIRCIINVFQAGLPAKRLTLSRDNQNWSSKKPLNGALQIQAPLEGSVAMRTLIDLVSDNRIRTRKTNQAEKPSELKACLYLPTDLLRARARFAGKRLSPNNTFGHTIASIQKEFT